MPNLQVPHHVLRLSRTEAPSLPRHDPASSVLWASPPPSAPGLSLTGIRLIIPDHAQGFPCCVRFPCVHAAATTPVQRLGVVFARVTQPCQPSPVPRPDRPAHRPFRGLLSVHSRCGLHTRTVTVYRDRYPKASDTSSPPCLLRWLPAGAVAGWGLHPLEKRRLVTAHAESCRCTVPASRPGSSPVASLPW